MADLELLAPPVYEVRLGGAVVTPLFSSFKISETLDAADTLLADLVSVSAPYLRPLVGQSLIVTENSVRIFGGTVTGVRERSLIGAVASKIVVEVQATSYELNAERRLITRAFNDDHATDTIGSAFNALVNEFYAAVGVTLHPAQTDGPILPQATFERVSGAAVNKQLAASVGYLQSIDFDNRLRAWAPGEIVAPWSYDELVNPELLTGDITVERGQLQSGYANRVILTGDPIPVPDFREHYTGDGATNTWPVTYKVNGPYPTLIDGAIGFGIVAYPDGNGGASGLETTESIGGTGSPMVWKYDALTNTITRSLGPVGAGVKFEFPYHGLFIPEGMAEDAAEIAQYGLWEHIEEVTAVLTNVSAQQYADAVLAAKIAGKEEIITLPTRALGFHPGQVIPVSSPSRELTGEYLITQVETVTQAGDRLLWRTLTASKSLNNNHDWRRVYQQWAGASAGGSSSLGSTVVVGGGLHGASHRIHDADPIPGVGYLDGDNTWRGVQTIPVLVVPQSLTITPPQFRVGNSLVTVTGPVTLPQTIPEVTLPPNLAYTNVDNNFSVGQRFLGIGLGSLTGYGRINIDTAANQSAIAFHFPGVDVWQVGRRNTALAFSKFADASGNLGTDVLAITTNPDPGGIGRALLVGYSPSDYGFIQAIQTGVALKELRLQPSGGGTTIGGALTVNANVGVAGLISQNQPTIYIGGFAVTVTANCSIPSTGGGGVELPPGLAYYNASNPWSATQAFLGITVNGVDVGPKLANIDQPVLMTSTPTFAGAIINGQTNINGNLATQFSVSAGTTFICNGESGTNQNFSVIGGRFELQIRGGIIVLAKII